MRLPLPLQFPLQPGACRFCALLAAHFIGAATDAAFSGRKVDEIFCAVHPVSAFEISQLLLQMRPSARSRVFKSVTHKLTRAVFDKVQQGRYLLGSLRGGLTQRLRDDGDKAAARNH